MNKCATSAQGTGSHYCVVHCSFLGNSQDLVSARTSPQISFLAASLFCSEKTSFKSLKQLFGHVDAVARAATLKKSSPDKKKVHLTATDQTIVDEASG